ncbi:MAG TPA: helix-turn-helix transcriptional regulator [Anaeromyxobacteraceae bacterium]|nr:helix-turn-helix transcriptional regulator [Anaeromyxobacteraceae bacterium]
MTLAQRFSHNLRHERERRKMSQFALSKRAGMSTSYVSMLERNQRTPPLETLSKLAKALKVSPTSLLH